MPIQNARALISVPGPEGVVFSMFLTKNLDPALKAQYLRMMRLVQSKLEVPPTFDLSLWGGSKTASLVDWCERLMDEPISEQEATGSSSFFSFNKDAYSYMPYPAAGFKTADFTALPAWLQIEGNLPVWMSAYADLRILYGLSLKQQLAVGAADIAAGEARLSMLDTAARVALGIATVGTSEAVRLATSKWAEMKTQLNEYRKARDQARLILADPSVDPAYKAKLKDAVDRYEPVLNVLLGGQSSAAEVSAALANDPNLPDAEKRALGEAVAKAGAEASVKINVADILAKDASAQGVQGLGLISIAGMISSIPALTTAAVAIGVIALISAALYVLWPLIGAVVKVAGGRGGVLLILALGGVGYLAWRNRDSLMGKLSKKLGMT